MSKTAAERLFSCGYQLDLLGYRQIADVAYRRGVSYLENAIPSSLLGETVLAHGVNLYRVGRIEEARVTFQEAVRIFDTLLQLNVNSFPANNLMLGLRWLGYCQLGCGHKRLGQLSLNRAAGIRKQLDLLNHH